MKWLFIRNWQASLAVLALWFVYAALRDGTAIHRHFLGLYVDPQSIHGYPPWIVIFAVEAVVLAWHFLPSKKYSRYIRPLAVGSGVVLLLDVIFSHPMSVGLERAVAIYVFASIFAYGVFWPSEVEI